MFSYQAPIESLKRILVNDKSGDFKIIVKIQYNKRLNDDFSIQKNSKIIINTTVNKARILSKIIDDKYSNNPNIDHYVFDLGNLNHDVQNKIHFSDIINIFKVLIDSDLKEISISEEKRNVFNIILKILETGNCDINEITIIKCNYNENDMLNGIISYIKRITNNEINGNNEHLKLSSRGSCKDFPLSNLLLLNENRKGFVYWPKIDDNNAWIEFDFGKRKINMTSYTIQTIYNPTNCFHPKTWKFIGSNDTTNWELIDIKENNDELNGKSNCAHFICQNNGKFYRYIKYVQLDNWRHQRNGTINKYYIGLSSIEFFGEIKSE